MSAGPSSTHIGFIGLGVMGRPMAERLLSAGYDLVVHNRSRGAIEAIAGQGGRDGRSPAGVGRASDVLITMLPDARAVGDVLFGPDGAAAGLRRGSTVVDMSTIAPAAVRDYAARLAERGVSMLDAPVSGGEGGAKAGTLAVMVGGDAPVCEACRPILECMGNTVVHMGPTGAGQTTKACNQIIVALTIQGVAEALALARRSGLDPARVREVLLGGYAQSRVLEVLGPRMLTGNFRPGGRASFHLKDIRIAYESGLEAGALLPMTSLVYELFVGLRARGFGNIDHSAVAYLQRDRGGAQFRELGGDETDNDNRALDN